MTNKAHDSSSEQTQHSRLQDFDQQNDPEVDVEKLHAAVYREKTDPREGSQPVPIWLILSSFALLMWGGWYLGNHSADFAMDRYEGPAAFTNQGPAAVEVTKPVVDPMLMGKRIYSNCSACHQVNGMGVAGQFPPLVDSEWVSGRADNLARILLQGLQGPIQVNGKRYNGNMPKWAYLDDASLAAVLTYIRGSWGNASPPVPVALVTAVRQATRGRTNAWTAEELQAAAVVGIPDADSEDQSSNMGSLENDSAASGTDQ